jgi:hypothetical protein
MMNLTQYQPVQGGMGQNPQFADQYKNDALIQELFRNNAMDQILGAFTPKDGGQGQNSAFLDMLLGKTQQPTATPTPSTPADAAKAAEEVAKMLYDSRNDGYDAPGGYGGGDGYGLYGAGYAGTGMYNAPALTPASAFQDPTTGYYGGGGGEGGKSGK